MEEEETAEKLFKNIKKTERNSNKLIPRFLIYLNKINSVSDFDEFFKDKITVPLIDWFIEYFILKFFLIFFCLSALVNLNIVLKLIYSMGISISWFLLVELKNDLWRKNG